MNYLITLKKTIIIFICCLFFGCQNTSHKNSISILDSLSILLQNDPSNIDVLKKRAGIYIEKNDFLSAQIDIDYAYQLFKNDADLLLRRGEVYFELNQTRISKESWERCLSLEPNNIKCREKLTQLFCLVQDRKCRLMIDTLALLNNNMISLDLIISLKENQEYSKAIYFLNNLIDVYPKNKDALSLLSIIHSDTSVLNNEFNSQLAEEYFMKIINLYPKYKIVYYNFGKYKQDILQYQDALEMYGKYLKLDFNNKQIYYNMGFCYLQLEDYEKSIDSFTKAINIDSSFLLAYHARAYLYELTNRPEKAKLDWKNCLMLSPSYIPALEGLSK